MSWGAGLGYLRHSADADSKPFDPGLFRRLMGYVRPYRRDLTLAVAVACGGALMTVAAPYLLKVGIDQGILAHRARVILWTAGLYLASRVLAGALAAVQTLAVNRLGNGAVFDLRADLFAQLMVLGTGFFDQQPVGVLVSRGTNDVTALSNLVSSGIVSLITDAVTLIGIVAIMLAISPPLALAAFVTLPLLVLITRWFQRRATAAYRAVRTRIGELTADLEEALSGIRVSQAFAREEENSRRFAQTNAANLQANMDAAAVNTLFAPTVSMISTLGTVIVLWFGGVMVLHHAVRIGVLVAFTNYLSRFFQPIQDLTQQFNAVQQAMAAAEKLFQILDTPVEVRDAPGATLMPRIQGHVRFRHVTFGYVPDRPAVRDLDFELPAGCRAALVGPTGAGKSTVAGLLLRFHDPQQGSIEVDGIDLRTVTQRSYRAQVAMVLQDPVLFSGSVADNIRYGQPDAAADQIRAVARLIGVDEFARQLPQGYDTPVGERGARLSQGQKQLIAFARALLADPRILILDEATAYVDSETEQQIQRAMAVLLPGRTALIIAHRLATVRDADLILVLQNGRVVQQGTHAQLMAQGGLYAALYQRQFADVAAGV